MVFIFSVISILSIAFFCGWPMTKVTDIHGRNKLILIGTLLGALIFFVSLSCSVYGICLKSRILIRNIQNAKEDAATPALNDAGIGEKGLSIFTINHVSLHDPKKSEHPCNFPTQSFENITLPGDETIDESHSSDSLNIGGSISLALVNNNELNSNHGGGSHPITFDFGDNEKISLPDLTQGMLKSEIEATKRSLKTNVLITIICSSLFLCLEYFTLNFVLFLSIKSITPIITLVSNFTKLQDLWNDVKKMVPKSCIFHNKVSSEK